MNIKYPVQCLLMSTHYDHSLLIVGLSSFSRMFRDVFSVCVVGEWITEAGFLRDGQPIGKLQGHHL